MRTLLISFDLGELCMRLASALVQHVDEVYLLLPREVADPHMDLLDPSVRFETFQKPRLRQFVRQIRTMTELVRRIRRINPDVIHLQMSHLWFNLSLLFLRRYPLVVTIHDPRAHVGDRGGHNTPQVIRELAYRRAHRVIAHNEQMKRIIVDEVGVSSELVHVVPHIQLGDPAGSDSREESNLVLFFGRIWAYKGLEYFIRAQPLITEQIPDARFVIAGKGDDFERYTQMMASPERFEVHNEFVSFEMREELFSRASVVALPYVEATQSGVIPVAYSHGKPVVATAVGGLPSQVEDGKTGFLVPPRDVGALADRVVQLLREPGMRHRMGANGRRKLLDEWSAEAIARQTVPVYREAWSAAQVTRHRRRKSVREAGT